MLASWQREYMACRRLFMYCIALQLQNAKRNWSSVVASTVQMEMRSNAACNNAVNCDNMLSCDIITYMMTWIASICEQISSLTIAFVQLKEWRLGFSECNCTIKYPYWALVFITPLDISTSFFTSSLLSYDWCA